MVCLEFSHSFLTPFRLFLQMFLFLHFLRAQKLLEGFCRDSSNSSICALLISWPLKIHYFLSWNMCLYFLLIIEDGICNVISFRLVNCASFSPWPPSIIIIIMTFVHIHTLTFLLPKNYSRKKAKS